MTLKSLQLRRGTAADHALFIGEEGEITYNSTNDSIHAHDGVTSGGFETARIDLNNVSDLVFYNKSVASGLLTQAVTAVTATGLAYSNAAATSAGLAAANAAIQNILSTTPVALPYEVTAISGGVGTGTGGTNGEYALGVTGGPDGHEAFVTITGGTIASYRIANPGLATTNAVPTYSLSGVTGLTGATIPTATVGTIPVNRQFGAPSTDGLSLVRWQNVAGVLTQTTPAQYTKTGVDAVVLASENFAAASTGLKPSLRNMYDPALATTGQYVNTVGALSADVSYTASALIPVSPSKTYRFKKAVNHLAYYDSVGALIGSVVTMAADTSFTPPAGAVSCRFSQLNSTLTRPKQMLIPTSTTVATLPYIAPYNVDSVGAKRDSLSSAVQVQRSLMQQGVQIFDAAACTDGFALDQSNGGNSANASYSMSGYIAVDRSTMFSQSSGPMTAFYAEDRSYLGFSSPAAGAYDPVALFPDACWIRVQLLTSTKSTYRLGYGTTPVSATFGYTSQSVVDLTAMQKARVATAAVRGDDANVLNPNKVVINRGLTSTNGSPYALAGWSVTGLVEVNPLEYFSTTNGTNAGCFYDSNGTFVASAMNAVQTFTASITDNIMDVTVAPSTGLFIGQRISYTGKTPGNILRQLTGTTGGIGTYLMSQRQGTPIVSAATFSAGPYFDSNKWIQVPANCYYAQWQFNATSGFSSYTVKQGRTAIVDTCTFTADISGNTMNVTAIATGSRLVVGQRVIGPNMTTCNITAIPAGGSTGAYTVSVSQTVASQTMYAGDDPAVTQRTFGGVVGAITKPYDGKKLVILGDSISYTAGYVPYVLTGTGMTLLANHSRPGRAMKDALFSWNGTTATALDSTNFATADAVILNLGTNDWSVGGAETSVGSGVFFSLGTIADANPGFAGAVGSSFYGDAFRAINQILTWNPLVRIFVATPLKRGVVSGQPTYPGNNNAGVKLDQYAQAVREVAELFGAPVIDQFSKSGFNPYNILSLTGDGLHPSNATAHARQASVHIGTINAS